MDKFAGFIARLKRLKHKEILLCCLAVATVLGVYYACVSCSEKTAKKTSADYSGTDYCTAMQARLENVVSEIDGVGSAAVVINWDRSVQHTFSGGTSENPKATGVLVVCDGGGKTKVKLDIIYAVSTLLDLSIEKISVYPKSK